MYISGRSVQGHEVRPDIEGTQVVTLDCRAAVVNCYRSDSEGLIMIQVAHSYLKPGLSGVGWVEWSGVEWSVGGGLRGCVPALGMVGMGARR